MEVASGTILRGALVSSGVGVSAGRQQKWRPHAACRTRAGKWAHCCERWMGSAAEGTRNRRTTGKGFARSWRASPAVRKLGDCRGAHLTQRAVQGATGRPRRVQRVARVGATLAVAPRMQLEQQQTSTRTTLMLRNIVEMKSESLLLTERYAASLGSTISKH